MLNKQGFTLIELVTAVMIIAVLTAIAVPQYRASVQRAEATEALINLRTIFESAVRYKSQTGSTPTKVAELDISFFDSRDVTGGSMIGSFGYVFKTSYIKSCWIDSNNNNSIDTYCFSIYYNHNTYGKGALSCQYNAGSAKYSKVCSAFCTEKTNENPCWIDVP